jgi:predicted  nucleic acid-binding Zn-ribbon protein
MEDNFFDFAQTKEALSALSTELVELETSISAKESKIKTQTQEFQNCIQNQNEKIALLRQTAQDALTKVEALSKYVEGVL